MHFWSSGVWWTTRLTQTVVRCPWAPRRHHTSQCWRTHHLDSCPWTTDPHRYGSEDEKWETGFELFGRDNIFHFLKTCWCVLSLKIPPPQQMPSFADKSKDKSIDLQNFGLRTDFYNKKNTKVSKQLPHLPLTYKQGNCSAKINILNQKQNCKISMSLLWIYWFSSPNNTLPTRSIKYCDCDCDLVQSRQLHQRMDWTRDTSAAGGEFHTMESDWKGSVWLPNIDMKCALKFTLAYGSNGVIRGIILLLSTAHNH